MTATALPNTTPTAARSMSGPPKKRRWTPSRVLVWLMLGLLLFVSVVPILVVIKTAIQPPKGFFTHASELIPRNTTLFNFKRVLGQVSKADSIAVGGSAGDFNYFTALKNSLIFTLGSLVGQMFFSTLAAYAFARLRFPGRNIIFGIILSAMMVPAVVLFIPNFILMRDLHWLNTFHGQIAPYFLMTPFAVFFMRQFFLSFPTEMEESARIDGAGTFKIFRKVVLPNSKGPLATLAIISTINLWNEYFWPFLIAKDKDHYPLTVALSAFKSQQPQGGKDWPGLMAGTTLALIPVVLLVIFLGKKVVESLQFTGGK
jgi:multiple sugar transport system permease protein